MIYRKEKDTLGIGHVPVEKYWGAQTERCWKNFRIGPEASLPIEIIYSFGFLKKAAAHAKFDFGICLKRKEILFLWFVMKL